MFKFTRKRVVLGLSGVAALALAAVAVAYFTSSGSGSGSGAVGASAPFTLTLGTPSFSGGLSAIYPGAGTETVPFTVTNAGNGNENLSTVTPTIDTDNSTGDVKTSTGTVLTGCLASWFTISDASANPALPDDLAPQGTYTGSVQITMSDSATDQDACQNAAPGITVAVS